MASIDQELLFDPTILTKAAELLDKTNPTVDLEKHGCVIRPLAVNDFEKSFGDLLSELNPIGNLDSNKFKEQFHNLRATNSKYYIVVIEDTRSGKLVAAGALLLDPKFYRANPRGRIEMLIVEEKYRGRGFGALMVRILTCIGQYTGCYIVSLETQGYNRNFYLDKCYYKEETDIYMDIFYPEVKQERK